MKQPNKKLWTALTGVSSVSLAVLLVGTAVANHFDTSINAYFQCDTFKVVSSGEAIDTNYYPDEWQGYDDWFEAYEQDLCTRTEAEGAVLLKNSNNALPLASNAKVSLFSHSSVDMIYGGTGSGSVNTSTAPNLRQSLESVGAEVNGTLWSFYNTGNGSSYKRTVPALSSNIAQGDYTINETPWSVLQSEAGLSDTYAQYGDAAIFVLARSGGEGMDLAVTTATDAGTDGDYLALSDTEKEVLTNLKALKDQGVFKKIVVLLDSSNAVNCNFIEDEQYGIDACLWIGGVGAYGNNAVANILLGITNPSGRLVDTYLYDNKTNPSVVNFGSVEYPNAEEVGLNERNADKQTTVNYSFYQEGIYVGYKYYETRYEDQVMGTGNAGDAVAYDYNGLVYRPFGYGLSYSDYSYSDFSVKDNGDAFDVTTTVTNTGSVAGKHTVQVYMQKPYTDYDKQNHVEKSAVELVGFDKTGELTPGQSETVTISVPKELMKSYDAYGERTYIVDDGTYYLTVGADSHDAVNNILAAKGYTPDNSTMDAAGNADMVGSYEQAKFDAETYSVSTATGAEITNRFDDADPVLYDGFEDTVTYLSRSDWTGTYPQEQTVLHATEKLAADVANVFVPQETDADGNAYEMPKYNQKNGLTLAMMMGRAYDDPAWDDLLDQMSWDEQHDIIVNAFHNTKAANSISKPASIETNGPQGITNSFFGGKEAGMAYPAEVVMAATWNTDIMEEIGTCIGIQGLKSKTNGVYGPAANIHRNAYCGRNYEYFSEDAFLSGRMMAPEVAAIQSQGVYVLMKHFALNDMETNRGGNMAWANEQSIREIYLTAFEPGVTEGGASGVMTIMNRIGAIWGGAHHGLLTDVLRNEWGMQGIVITDFSSNSNYTLQTVGLQAGTDIWDGFSATDLTAYKDNAYVAQLIRKAMHDLLFVQANSSVVNGLAATDKIVSVLTWWQTALIAADVVLAVLTAGCIFMLVKARKKKNG